MDLMPLVSAVVTYLSICCTSVVAQGEGAVEVPGGITDGVGEVLYVTGAKFGVAAVDAESGDVLWECADAFRPLVLVDHRLAVLANEPGRPNVLRVRFLDVEEKGARAGESEPLVFPSWVDLSGRYHDRPGQRFELRASLVGGELQLHWTAGTSYVGGVPPPPEVIRDYQRSAAGLVVIDPRSGGVTMRSLPEEDETAAVGGWTPLEELPQPVQELARREKWQFARRVGARVFGQTKTSAPPPRLGGVYSIQAVDLATGRLLWQRPIGEELVYPPRP